MEILDLSLTRLRNEEHHEFHAGFFELVNRFGVDTLGISMLIPPYTELFSNEGDALNFIRKNGITDEMVESDIARDTTTRGFIWHIKSACSHFDINKRKAGERIQIVLDEFGDIAEKPFDMETTSINSLVSKLTRDYAADIATLGVNDWLTELLNQNTAYTALTNNRYTNETTKTQFRMKEVRLEVDAAYRGIVKRMNALIELNGPSAYSDFVKELNLRIAKYGSKKAVRTVQNENTPAEQVR